VRTVLALWVAGLALAACGSEAPTKSDYLAIVNDRCSRLQARTLDLAEEHFGDLEEQPTDRQVEVYTQEAVRIQREALGDLRERPAPDGDEDTLEQIYASWEEALDAATQDLESADARRSADEFREGAEDYGLTECAGL
jgi:hypothetical protein